MPELPEVQTIVSDLNKKIKGDIIVGFWSDWKKAIKNISAKKFGEEIKGRKILGARRIGKNIFIDLSGGRTIYIHLKMTGHLLVKSRENFEFPRLPDGQGISNFESKTNEIISNDQKERKYFNEKVNQYIRHIFYLKSKTNLKFKIQNFNKTLEFSDLRKFGKIVLVDTSEIENLKEIKSLGMDALDRKFNLKKFREILERMSVRVGSASGRKKIGIILMDQNLIAGIGNIYRSEILFDAKILPTRKVSDLKSKEIENLYKSIKKILKQAVKMRGTSDSDYRDTAGASGKFQKVLKVYRREKQKCKKCDTIIKRIKLGQRSVYYCPDCQK